MPVSRGGVVADAVTLALLAPDHEFSPDIVRQLSRVGTVERIRADVRDPDQSGVVTSAPVGAVVWVTGHADAVQMTASLYGQWPSVAAVLEVISTTRWGDACDSSSDSAVTRVSFLRRRSDISRAAFATHWRDVHAPLARLHNPTVAHYVQSLVVRDLLGTAPTVDGIASLRFRSRADLTDRFYGSPEGMRLLKADLQQFIDGPSPAILASSSG